MPLATEGWLVVRTYLSLLNSAGSPWQPHYKHESCRGTVKEGRKCESSWGEGIGPWHTSQLFLSSMTTSETFHLRKYSAAWISVVPQSYYLCWFTYKQIYNRCNHSQYSANSGRGAVAMALSCNSSFKPQVFFIFHHAVSHRSPLLYHTFWLAHMELLPWWTNQLLNLTDGWRANPHTTGTAPPRLPVTFCFATEGQLNKLPLSFLYLLIPHSPSISVFGFRGKR